MRYLSLIATAALVVGTFATSNARAETMDELAEKAAAGGPVHWYEANSPEMGDKIVAAFQERFPDVELRFERVTGAQGITARIVQETEADAPSADATTTGVDQIVALYDRGLVADVDWAQYGVPETLTPTSYAVAATSATWVIVYNTDQVSAEEAPKTWDDLTDPEWKNRIGLWAIGHSQANLAAAWGEERVTAFTEALVKNEPLLFKSNFTIAQHLASGELSVGITPLHVALATKAKGAPIEIVAPEPTPLSMIYSAVLKEARNPAGAKLLVVWLSSEEGALAYEKATGRGNPYLSFTETAAYLEGRELSTFAPHETAKLQELVEKYTTMLRTAGTAR